MADETVTRNLQRMDELDFAGWTEANWEGVFIEAALDRADRKLPGHLKYGPCKSMH